LKVLVWGALGFLGRHLVEALLGEGAQVSVLCRSRRRYETAPWADDVTWYELQGFRDEGTILSAVASAELIYNFAGSSGAVASNINPKGSMDANCGAQLEFLKACECAGHRPHVVFASSWLIYNLTGAEPVTETQGVAPRSMYAAHKLCVENYLQIANLRRVIDYTIFRISNPYGTDRSAAGRGYKVLNSFIRNAISGVPIQIYGDGRQLRDFIHISDLIEAFLLCASPVARNETFNISYGTSYSLIEAVNVIREIVGTVSVIHRPWPAEYAAVEPGDYVVDITKATTMLDFVPCVSLLEGLKQTIYELTADNSISRAARAGVSI